MPPDMGSSAPRERGDTLDSDALLAELSFSPAFSSDEEEDWIPCGEAPVRVLFSVKNKEEQTDDGVQVPPLLSVFFGGLNYLPYPQEANQVSFGAAKEVPPAHQEEDASTSPSQLTEEEEETPGLKKKRAGSMLRMFKKKRKQRAKQRESSMERPPRSNSTPRSNSSKALTTIQKQQAKLQQHKVALQEVQEETLAVETQVKKLQSSLASVEAQVAHLEQALAESMTTLQRDTKLLEKSKKELKRLEAKRDKMMRAVQETSAGIPTVVSTPQLQRRRSSTEDAKNYNDKPPLRKRADSAPTALRRAESSSFIRIHDLPMECLDNSSLSDTSSTNTDVCFLDTNITTVLPALAQFGKDIAVDESDRFTPVLNTEKLLSHCPPTPNWPIQPWHAAFAKEILVWTGSVQHAGHGCQLPLVKARGIIPASPRNVLNLMMDSSRVGEYNKMSLGRQDVVFLQKGIDTLAQNSPYGLPGEAKIIKSLTKPPLIRKSIEMLSLIYARRLDLGEESYLSVSRSVWEDSSATTSLKDKSTVRCEILLGVNLLRPIMTNAKEMHCEMTTITHAHTSVVPDGLARKMGPSQAATFLRELQSIFQK